MPGTDVGAPHRVVTSPKAGDSGLISMGPKSGSLIWASRFYPLLLPCLGGL